MYYAMKCKIVQQAKIVKTSDNKLGWVGTHSKKVSQYMVYIVRDKKELFFQFQKTIIMRIF